MPSPSPVAVLRGALLVILIAGMIGTGVELLLLEHTEGVWQLVPLALLGAGLVVLLAHALRPGATTVRAVQLTMLAFVGSGLAGWLLHYSGNVEFELEMHPTAAGLGLFWEAIKGATPTLAPGTMIQLGLLGLVHTYRHPALGKRGSAGTATHNSEQ